MGVLNSYQFFMLTYTTLKVTVRAVGLSGL